MVEARLNFKKPVLKGNIKVPGDKSISHRAIMFGSIAEGKTTVSGFLLGDDCLSTIECFRKLGVNIELDGTDVEINSRGIINWEEPTDILYTGNSGTTTRLMLGLLSGSNIHSILNGDASIAKRPMKRVITPLREMGAQITGRMDGQYTPLAIKGSPLHAIEYTMPVASAQVKSAILLAGIQAKGTTIIHEKDISRDHTERMLRQFGADVSVEEGTIFFKGGQTLQATHVEVPGDISSAAFFLVAGAMAENSEIILRNVGFNPSRTGIIDVLAAMGANMEIIVDDEDAAEPIATITIRTSDLVGVTIDGNIIPRLIDEIPIIALLATKAKGTTIIRDAAELKVKETDRITAVVTELKKLGADIEATEDGMIIHGSKELHGGSLKTYGDHRIGMMGAIASLLIDDEVTLDDADCIAVSYPTFFDDINKLIK
ncbi:MULTISPECIES: 3-phosphoshikimate 1-carboxyvinyltransferase [unclassified Rummeliibacillus]|uniref:3-phosphoshikimate 1-carboxyvinyltransferase n=1 Tax=unclassified Rummeliibacillus TaxID=2622809 RepID=UPI000E665A95|nr:MULTISPECIES: 3-phosphoshikimate 1-carboxyvinyltransferase [unclassified Rummeliibacillus]RIJ65789.1 3-phosphoshikimate 1-carboxyvinyltransferase [Rummeliibacillus sp. POC4]RPJ95729.1 3-phosphoshikimate 1-carboxyvinyltransferase [Rummeliibacillus sp. TYF005]